MAVMYIEKARSIFMYVCMYVHLHECIYSYTNSKHCRPYPRMVSRLTKEDISTYRPSTLAATDECTAMADAVRSLINNERVARRRW